MCNDGPEPYPTASSALPISPGHPFAFSQDHQFCQNMDFPSSEVSSCFHPADNSLVWCQWLCSYDPAAFRAADHSIFQPLFIQTMPIPPIHQWISTLTTPWHAQSFSLDIDSVEHLQKPVKAPARAALMLLPRVHRDFIVDPESILIAADGSSFLLDTDTEGTWAFAVFFVLQGELVFCRIHRRPHM